MPAWKRALPSEVPDDNAKRTKTQSDGKGSSVSPVMLHLYTISVGQRSVLSILYTKLHKLMTSPSYTAAVLCNEKLSRNITRCLRLVSFDHGTVAHWIRCKNLLVLALVVGLSHLARRQLERHRSSPITKLTLHYYIGPYRRSNTRQC